MNDQAGLFVSRVFSPPGGRCLSWAPTGRPIVLSMDDQTGLFVFRVFPPPEDLLATWNPSRFPLVSTTYGRSPGAAGSTRGRLPGARVRGELLPSRAWPAPRAGCVEIPARIGLTSSAGTAAGKPRSEKIVQAEPTYSGRPATANMSHRNWPIYGRQRGAIKYDPKNRGPEQLTKEMFWPPSWAAMGQKLQ